ncbi:hypothetical protein KY343_06130 [Candidatus Woesearchaeota archaeon]|nr:hypothetical protein [Candidatus Woesearchaeota archaeon]
MPDEEKERKLAERLKKFRKKEDPSAPEPPKPAPPPPKPFPRPIPRPVPRPPVPRRTNPLAEEIRRKEEMEAKRAASSPKSSAPRDTADHDRDFDPSEARKAMEARGASVESDPSKARTAAEYAALTFDPLNPQRRRRPEVSKKPINSEKVKGHLSRWKSYALCGLVSLFMGLGLGRGCSCSEEPEPEPTVLKSTFEIMRGGYNSERKKKESLQVRVNKLTEEIKERDDKIKILSKDSEAAAENIRLEENIKKKEDKIKELLEERNNLLEELKIARSKGCRPEDIKKLEEKAAKARYEFGDWLFDSAIKSDNKKEKIHCYKKAAEEIEKALALREDAQYYHLAGVSYFNLGCTQEEKEAISSWEKALPHLENAVIKRGNAYDHYLLGYNLEKLKITKKGSDLEDNCRRAIIHLEKSITEHDKEKKKGEPAEEWFSNAVLSIGNLYVYLGDSFESAGSKIREYRKSIDYFKKLNNNNLVASSLGKIIKSAEGLKLEERIQTYQSVIPELKSMKRYDILVDDLSKIIEAAWKLNVKERLKVLEGVMVHSKEMVSIRGDNEDYKLFDKNLGKMFACVLGIDSDKTNSILSDTINFADGFKGEKRKILHETVLRHTKELIRRGFDEDYSLLRRNIVGLFREYSNDKIRGELERLFDFTANLGDGKKVLKVYDSTIKPFLMALIEIEGGDHYNSVEKMLPKIVNERIKESEYSEAFDDLSSLMKSVKERKDRQRTYEIVMPLAKKLLESRGTKEDFEKVKNHIIGPIAADAVETKDYKLMQETLLDFVEWGKTLDNSKREIVFDTTTNYFYGTVQGWMLDPNEIVPSPSKIKDMDDYYHWLGKIFLLLESKEDSYVITRKTELKVRAVSMLEKALETIRNPKRKFTREENEEIEGYEGDIKKVMERLKQESKDWFNKQRQIASMRGKSYDGSLKKDNYLLKLARGRKDDDPDLAINAYEASIRLFGGTRKEFYELGMLYKGQGKVDKTIEYLGVAAKPFTKTDSYKIKACFELGEFYEEIAKAYKNSPNELTEEEYEIYIKMLKGMRKYYGRALQCIIPESRKNTCKEEIEKANKLLKLDLEETRSYFKTN